MKAWERLQPVIDRIVPIACEQGATELTEAERTVYYVWCYAGEVCNGGHWQFFFNSAGGFAFETVEALRQIGAPEFAKLLDRTINIFPDRRVPRGLEERNQILESLPDQVDSSPRDPGEIIEKADAEFSRLTDDALLDRLVAYWEAQL